MKPENFQQWKICITKDCKVNLTKTFAQERLSIYTDYKHPETKRFRNLYGQQHLDNIINWFKKI